MTSVPPAAPVGRCRALLITGTVGSGKTTTAELVGRRWQESGVPHAVVDLDELRRFWPTPVSDPFGSEVELVNLAAVARNFSAAGARQLVLAGVCESRADRDRYARTLDTPLVVCRLRGDLGQIRDRLRARHVDDESGRSWHLQRAAELDSILDRANVADVTIDVTGLSPDQVADAVVGALRM